MSIEQVILNAGSEDPNIRRPAEEQLKNAEQQDLPNFLGQLCMYLGDESNQNGMARQRAGMILKNTLVAKDAAQRKRLSERWIKLQLDVRIKLKEMLCRILMSVEKRIRSTAALIIGQIARIEVPAGLWAELVPMLVANIQNTATGPGLRQSSFETLGYVCEEVSVEFPQALQEHSNAVLTAIHSGMREEEQNNEIKHEATKALANALDFIKSNMAQQQERQIIMQMVFGVLKCPELKVREAAYQCLIQLATSYYQYLSDCISDIFTLTKYALANEQDDIKPYAIEIWNTICDEEIDLLAEIEDAKAKNRTPEQTCHNFISSAQQALLPLMLQCLTTQSEDVEDDTYDAAKAAGTCVSLISQTVCDAVVPTVMPFIQTNIESQNWRFKEAAILAFGCILEGPSPDTLKRIVEAAFPFLLSNMQDSMPLVKDTTAWTIGQICKFVPETINPEILDKLMVTLVGALRDKPKIACSAAWAIHNLADVMVVTDDSKTTPLSNYLQGLLTELLEVTNRKDVGESNLLNTAYEAINVLVKKAAQDKYDLIGKLIPVLMEKLKGTVLAQGLTGEEKEKQMEIQGLLCASLQTIISKLGKTSREVILPFADHLMVCFLKVLQTKAATVHEDALGAIGAVASCVGQDFDRYMTEFVKFLMQGLENIDEVYVSRVATGIVSEIAGALGDKLSPYCDRIMERLLRNLESVEVERTTKPQIIQTLADVAIALGPTFERYLPHVMTMLISASQAKCDDEDYDTQEYILMLREAVLEAYSSIVTFLGEKSGAFLQFIEPICAFLDLLASEQEREETILRLATGLVGDLADRLGKPAAQLLSRPSVKKIIEETAQNPDSSIRELAMRAQQEMTKLCS